MNLNLVLAIINYYPGDGDFLEAWEQIILYPRYKIQFKIRIILECRLESFIVIIIRGNV